MKNSRRSKEEQLILLKKESDMKKIDVVIQALNLFIKLCETG